MSSFQSPRLSKADEDAVRKLHKTVRATRFDDPVDQDSFLVASAESVLQFRPQIASFASIPDVGECVFAIRAQLQSNNARLNTPSIGVLADIQDFAGEIARTRQLFRDRRRAQTDRVRAAEGVAARAERRAALEQTSQLHQRIASPDDDAVSIPSSDEESDVAVASKSIKKPHVPAASGQANAAVPSSVQVPISPLSELEGLMVSLSVNGPTVPMASPLSPTLSLPDLVPIAPRLLRANGRDRMMRKMVAPQFDHGRATTHTIPNPAVPGLIALPATESVCLVPRPLSPGLHHPKLSYADDWLASLPKSIGSRTLRSSSPGNFKRFKKQGPGARRPKFKAPKRCYYCLATNHLLATCPVRESVD
ncbi:hypothetical protein MVEN_00929400 [Mycena venus]|uniref:Uncharacterized protein n=1 Tax=Mycena venus TaxID=2733690 RepID=A0A8H6YDF3_9AGAR|nr:hypothetical protein MVEN_00929400 [Mycena venus]